MLRQIAQSPSIIKLEARMVKKNKRKNKMKAVITTITFLLELLPSTVMFGQIS